jgi:ribosome-binding protein aMBF1 (putative translation factor)
MDALQQWFIEQREKRKLTIQQLAQNLNQPVSYIQDIEQGEHILEIVEFLRYCRAGC